MFPEELVNLVANLHPEDAAEVCALLEINSLPTIIKRIEKRR
jgi:hypothetical protein